MRNTRSLRIEGQADIDREERDTPSSGEVTDGAIDAEYDEAE